MQLGEKAIVDVDCGFALAFALALALGGVVVIVIFTVAIAFPFVVGLGIIITVFKPITHLLKRFLDFVVYILVIVVGFISVNCRRLRTTDKVPVTVDVMAGMPILEYYT